MIPLPPQRVHAPLSRLSIGLLIAVGGTACQSDFHAQNLSVLGSRSKDSGIPVVAYQAAWVEKMITYGPKKDHEDAKCPDPRFERTIETLPVGGGYEVAFDPAFLGKGEFTLELNDNGTVKSLTVNSDPQVAENLGAVTELIKTVIPAPLALEGGGGIPDECEITRTEIKRFARYTPGQPAEWENEPQEPKPPQPQQP